MQYGNTNIRFTVPFLPLLALVFITLKLVGTISWSWWWVTAPLWGPFALILGILALGLSCLGVFAGLYWLVKKLSD